MIKFLAYYFLIGTVCTMLIDYILHKVDNILEGGGKRLTNFERVLIILVWPMYSFVFIYNFIIGYTKK